MITPELARTIYDRLVPGWRGAPLAGGNRRVPCPFHTDKDPSLDIHEKELVWFCRAGCGGDGAIEFARRLIGKEETRELLRELDPSGADHRTRQPSSKGAEPAHNAKPQSTGTVKDLGPPTEEQVSALIRSRRAADPSNLDQLGVRWTRVWSEEWLGFPTLAGGWKLWALDGKGQFRLDHRGRLVRRNVGPASLVASPTVRNALESGRPIEGRLLDVEGESDALAAIANRITNVITSTGGAGSLAGHERHQSLLAAFATAQLIVIGDLDEPGRQGAEKRAGFWHGLAAIVRVPTLPGALGPKGDLRDFLFGRAATKDTSETAPLGTASDLEQLIDATPVWGKIKNARKGEADAKDGAKNGKKSNKPPSLKRAHILVKNLAVRLKKDPGIAFKTSVLAALAVLREHDQPAWARLRDTLKKANVSLRDLTRSLDALEPHTKGLPLLHERPACPYRASADGLIHLKRTSEGIIEIPLTNFSATIVGDVLYDDGAEPLRCFEIEATLHGQPKRFTIPASSFMAMTWLTEHLGAEGILYAGTGTRDHARVAVQSLSGSVPKRVVYAHTGWRRVGDTYVYLHTGGAIGPDGLVHGVDVELAGTLGRYRLPEPPKNAVRIEAVRTSLDLLNLGPLLITAPGIGATYLAPLCSMLGAVRPDFVLWFVGGSGTLKSEFAALLQAHYGAEFTRLTMPATFTATANSIERMLFAAQDALLTVDDYHPASDPLEAQKMAAVASRLLRGVGNGTGRARMGSNLQLRQDLAPRALALATGERLPSGHSNVARLFAVPSVPPGIDIERLTAAQNNTQLLPLAMAAYLHWIAQNRERLAAELPERFRQLRANARQGDGHRREPGQVAHLALGSDTLLRFAVEAEALTKTDAGKLRERIWQALQKIATDNAIELSEETPVQRFLALLADGVASRRIYLEATEGGVPDEPERWGWERRSVENGPAAYAHNAAAVLVGRLKGDWLCLYPEATFQYVTTAAKTASQVFPVDFRTLLKLLDDRGLITKQTDRRTVKETLGNTKPRVIKLRANALAPLLLGEREHGELGEQQAPSDDPEELIIR